MARKSFPEPGLQSEPDPKVRYRELQRMCLDIDITRGKPSPEQLSLSDQMLACTDTHMDGIDCRNYGTIEGLPSARQLFGEYLGVPGKNVMVVGNSSLSLMHSFMVGALNKPIPGARTSWSKIPHQSSRSAADSYERPIMLCPVPGYDRHHALCEKFNIEMKQVGMDSKGPIQREVKEAVRDPRVVGMWCVPKYSNPSGVTYSKEVVELLAEMETANSGFRLFWDLAYAHHDLTEPADELYSIFDACSDADNPGRPILFGSTSKVTHASAGVAFVAGSKRNLAWLKSVLETEMIGSDKLNQLRHVKFLKNLDGIRAHMKKHREILGPKFKIFEEVFERELGPNVEWSRPKGGYFIVLHARKHASHIVNLAGALGIKLTPPGATFPYGKDPDDEFIRIAPSFVPMEHLGIAAEAIALCVNLAFDGFWP